MSIWASVIPAATDLLGQGIARDVQSSNNATALSIAQLNSQSSLSNTAMLSKIVPIILGAVAVVVSIFLLKKKK